MTVSINENPNSEVVVINGQDTVVVTQTETIVITQAEGPPGPPGSGSGGGTGSVNSVNGDTGPDVILDAADVGAAPVVHTHALDDLETTGTPDATTFLSGDGTWKIPTGTGTGATTLDELSDVQVTTPAIDDVLAWDGSQWINGAIVNGTDGVSRVLVEDAGTYPVRPDPQDVPVMFIGVVDPTSLMIVGDVWQNTAADAADGEVYAQVIHGHVIADVTGLQGELDSKATPADIATASTADRDRANHTGTQSADTITNGTTNKAYTVTEQNKLAGVAPGATLNSPDATLLNRANHTGTQAISTVTGLQTFLDAKIDGNSLASIATSGSASDITSGTLPNSVLPPLAITSTFPVASEAEMLALTTADEGDVAVRSDISETFILKQVPASTLSNWVKLLSPTGGVVSVAGKTGVVSLVKNDVGLGAVDNTSDMDKPVSTATQAAIAASGGGGGGTSIVLSHGALSGPVDINASAAGAHILSASGDLTLSFSGFSDGAFTETRLDLTPGPYVVTWPDNISWPLGRSPHLLSGRNLFRVGSIDGGLALDGEFLGGNYATTPPIPAIGAAVYGGYFAGIIDTTQGNIIARDASEAGQRYMLIVSPKSMERFGLAYKTTDDAAPVSAQTRWDGHTATEVLANDAATYPAADYCHGLTYPGDGGSEWYLPAMDELELVYRNLKATTESNSTSVNTGNSFPGSNQAAGYNPSSEPPGSAYTSGNPTQTTATLFIDGGGEDLGSQGVVNYYMTVTEYSVTTAFVQSQSGSNSGIQFQGTKSSTNLYIRPVRRVLL